MYFNTSGKFQQAGLSGEQQSSRNAVISKQKGAMLHRVTLCPPGQMDGQLCSEVVTVGFGNNSPIEKGLSWPFK